LLRVHEGGAELEGVFIRKVTALRSLDDLGRSLQSAG
jgi:hypothetical protein